MPNNFDDIQKLINKARRDLNKEGKNPLPPMKEIPGLVPVDTPIEKLTTPRYLQVWESLVIRLLELGDDEDMLLESLMSYYRCYDRWGLWFPIFGCVHVSYLPGLYAKASKYYNS